MNPRLERAQFLIEQNRFDLAEQELRYAVADAPDDPYARTQLALSLSGQKRFADALTEAQEAVRLAPDWGYAHYILGHVYDDLEKYRPAEAAAREAVRLDPENAAYYALLSQVLIAQARWAEALDHAERGLQINSEDVACANLRAMALVKLRRRDDATVALDSAMEKDPENAVTHANRGWAFLHAGQHREAMESFREALRLDPHQEWAREGIVTAMKARSPVYRVMLTYFLWMSRLPVQTRYAVIFGLVIARNILAQVARSNPALNPFIRPLLVVYLIFVVLTWTADPLFNLLLRFDPVGRFALSPRQIRAANGVGICIWSCLAAGVSYLITHSQAAAWAGFGSALILIPLSATLNARTKGWIWGLGILTGLLALIPLSGMIVVGITEPLGLLIYLGLLAAGLGAGVFLLRRA